MRIQPNDWDSDPNGNCTVVGGQHDECPCFYFEEALDDEAAWRGTQ